ETDQIETQICSSCGAKGSTKTTPAYTFFLTDAKNTLSAKTTPAGGTVSLTSKTINVFSKSLMEEIAKRKDVNVVLTYKYDGKNVQVTIPAGTAIDTTCDYYGPVKMMSLYGYKLLDTFPGEIKASSIAEINDAVKGATVTLKGKNSYNVSDMLAISNRRDINVDLEVAYSGKTYVIHIPAGATVDVNSEWYGPLKLMSLYSFTTK
ncbi:MAG: hypothetical protein KBS85_05910, partial [Lachnospiraceae bacterium]|nr:hypothetical protein [Candidatus Merdinaster equi]